jgi:hypothetical protein
MKFVSDAADAWVPECAVFKTSDECLDQYPSEAAVGLFNGTHQRKHEKLRSIVHNAIQPLYELQLKVKLTAEQHLILDKAIKDLSEGILDGTDKENEQ